MSEIPEDIKNMAERIRTEKEKRKGKKVYKKEDERKNLGIVIAFHVSAELIAGVLVGAGIGYILDEIFDFHSIGLLIFTILGCMAGILNVYRYIKRIEENQEKE